MIVRAVLGLMKLIRLKQARTAALEVAVKNAEGQRTVRIYEAGDTLDDVVGPLVNREVIVDALLLSNGKHLLRDIQGAE
jgi:sirohydrochlorin ferrochelatase